MRTLSSYNANNQQKGYILPFVLILLLIVMLSSAAFFNRSTTSAEISGQQRDTTQALLLAESVLNRFAGRFTDEANKESPNRTDINDIDGDGHLSPDFKRVKDIFPTLTTVPGEALPFYMYYIASSVAAVPVGTTPIAAGNSTRILQAVANGESSAAGSNFTAGTGINNQQIAPSSTRFKVNDLFLNANRHPLLFAVNASGIPVKSTANDWNAETAPNKAAVWVELVANIDADELDIFASTMAQVGLSRSYLQVRLGHHTFDRTLGGLLSPLSESGNRF